MVEVLEEVEDRDDRVGEVRPKDQGVGSPLGRCGDVSHSHRGHDKHEDGAEPDEPVRLELLGRTFEFLMGRVPSKIREAPGDLRCEAAEERPEQYVGACRLDLSVPSAPPLDTLLYRDALTYANADGGGFVEAAHSC